MTGFLRPLAVAACVAVVAAGAVAGAVARSAPHAPTVADLVPDAYGLEALSTTPSGTQVSFFDRRPCPAVLDTLRAGQWSIAVVGKPTRGSKQYTATMTYGARAAMLTLNGSGSSCSGNVQVESEQPATMSGAAAAGGTARALPVYCHVGPDLNGSDPNDLQVSYVGLYRTPAGSFLLMASGAATKGTHKLVADDEETQGLTVLPVKPGRPPLAAAARFMAGWSSGDGLESSIKEFVGMFAGNGTLTVTSVKPWAATVTAPALTDQAGHAGRLSITAGVACDG